ncbi:MAG: rod shape-determining protein MreC [Candidatus Omnitrophica bacterium]|nr:rod shape-determining protein MreC [Candidatus Omnitrophota bacterium]
MPRLLILKRSWIYAASAIAIILVIIFVPSSSSGIRNAAIAALLAPARGLGGVGEYFSSKKDLIRENRSLKKEIGELSLNISRFEDLEEENSRLRELLGFRRNLGFETVSAEVIARNPNDWIGSFMINKGEEDGISKNSAVCSSEGLLGKVVDPGGRISPVMMMTHPGFKTGGILKDTRINGIVVGEGKGRARMLYIPIDAEISPGAEVITSGYSRIFPKGIPVGEVVSVGKSRTGLYQYAVIRPFADPMRQEEVLCIK